MDTSFASRRGYADGPYGQIHYRDVGAGTPLLLVHQSPMSHRQFDSVYAGLAAAGIRAIGIDMPGFGMSDPPDFVPTIADYAKILPALLDHFGIESIVALGHHTGAQVVTEMAAHFPAGVRALILNGPCPFPAAMRAQFMQFVEEKEKNFTPRPDGSHLAEAFATRLSFANEDTRWDLATRYIAEQFGGLGPLWYGHHAAFVYDHAASIKTIAKPTLILTNTGDQIYDLALETKAMRPDFAFVEIAGGGIDITDEKPAEWVAAVSSYVAGLA